LLLADYAHLIPAVGEIRWREWAAEEVRYGAIEKGELDWWIDVTALEAGRDGLPITWVAIDEEGNALGVVGLGEFDIEERRDRSPWVLGMIVEETYRGAGIGRQLLGALEAWARDRGYGQVWVATGDPAVDFYRRCGWGLTETLSRAHGDTTHVLMKRLEP
jgi:GNAT superfamily N-acetyltransferase